MFTNKIKLQYGWLVILTFLVPSIAFGQADNQGVRRYLSLGTSLAAGVQPDAIGENQPTDDGYADQLLEIIEPLGGRKLKLIKLGCPGETTVTMMEGGNENCEYDEGSQLAQALVTLRAHKDKIALITIDIGVNDILQADCIDDNGNVDVVCIILAVNQIGTNLPMILTAIRDVAPNIPIVGMNYYNPFLAAWLTGNQALAFQSDFLANLLLNQGTLAPAYGAFGIPVADVYSAFNSGDFDTMVPFPPPFFMVPLNVATLCTLTYNCTPPPVGPNIHANPDGYGVIAGAFAAVLLP